MSLVIAREWKGGYFGDQLYDNTVEKLSESINFSIGEKTPYVVFASDLHITESRTTVNQHDRRTNCDTLGYTEKMIERINNLNPRPAALIVTGDISHGGDKKDLQAAAKALKKLNGDIELIVIPGNHDYGNHKSPSLGPMKDAFDVKSFNVPHELGNWRIIPLVNGINGDLAQDQMKFLRAQLQKSADKPVMILLHYPPVQTIDSVEHMPYDLGNVTKQLAAELAGRREATWILSGHTHVNLLAHVIGDECDFYSLTQTASTYPFSSGDSPSFRLLFLGENDIEQSALCLYATETAGFRLDPNKDYWVQPKYSFLFPHGNSLPAAAAHRSASIGHAVHSYVLFECGCEGDDAAQHGQGQTNRAFARMFGERSCVHLRNFPILHTRYSGLLLSSRLTTQYFTNTVFISARAYAAYVSACHRVRSYEIGQNACFLGICANLVRDHKFFGITASAGNICNYTKSDFGDGKFHSHATGFACKFGHNHGRSLWKFQTSLQCSYLLLCSGNYLTPLQSLVQMGHFNGVTIAPGLKISRNCIGNWETSLSGSYIYPINRSYRIVTEETVLPSMKNSPYVNCGLRLHREWNHASVCVDLNRCDDGQRGWNASLHIAYYL